MQIHALNAVYPYVYPWCGGPDALSEIAERAVHPLLMLADHLYVGVNPYSLLETLNSCGLARAADSLPGKSRQTLEDP
jgi:hypothetical protein